MGHIAFHHDVITSVCQNCNYSLANAYVYIQIYIDIYVCISLGGHNFGTFYSSKLKFGMLLT